MRWFPWRRPCTMHAVIENGVYPYRCVRCGSCFLCQHTAHTHPDGTRCWICPDGAHFPATPSPGVPVTVSPS